MTAAVLDGLRAWVTEGHLSRLGGAMATQALVWDPQAPSVLLVAVAVLTHLEGRGHTCLSLSRLTGRNTDWGLEGDPTTPLPVVLPPSGAAWLPVLQSSPLIRWCLGPSQPMAWMPDTGQPLVLAGDTAAPVLYLRRHWVDECTVAALLLQRAAQRYPVDTGLVQLWLNRLFDTPAQRQPDDRPDWQQIACALALRSGVTVVTGGPGTGKTFTAARLLAMVHATHPQPAVLKVGLAAPTGKAAARLRSAIDQALQDIQARLGTAVDVAGWAQRMGPARTLHAWLGARADTRLFRHGPHNPLDLDVLVVDETSMVHLEMMAALLRALPSHTRLVLLGDKDQLASVEAGAVLGELCQNAETARYNAGTQAYLQATCGTHLAPAPQTGGVLEQQTVMLRESRRFGSGIGRYALAVNSGALGEAAASADGAVWTAPAPVTPDAVVALALRGRPGAPGCYTGYLDRILTQPHPDRLSETDHGDWARGVLQAFDTFRVLCAVHDGPWGDRATNLAVEAGLATAGYLRPTSGWYTGRPVLVTRNEFTLAVSNGDVGVALPAPGSGRLRVYFLDGLALRSVAVGRLAHVETCFAMTIHKSQGSEFDHTVVVLPGQGQQGLSRELVYTAVTRAKTHLSLVEPEPGLLAKASQARLPRFSGLAAQLAAQG